MEQPVVLRARLMMRNVEQKRVQQLQLSFKKKKIKRKTEKKGTKTFTAANRNLKQVLRCMHRP